MKELILKLFFSIIIFTIILISTMYLSNREVLKNNIREDQKNTWSLVESRIINDMATVDKAYVYFDTTVSKSTKNELEKLRNYYEVNPNIYSWDIEAIKERTGMEFYIVDDKNKVVVTTYEPGLNLDFEQCCEKFADLLDDRRMSDEFFSDGLDNSAVTMELWKYSYLATRDHRYILELGMPLQNNILFETFNFFDTIEQLTTQYEDLKTLRIISHEGFFLDLTDDMVSVNDFAPELKNAYEHAAATNAPSEFVQSLDNGRKLINRFVPYEAEVKLGNSTKRIIYFQYSNDNELKLLENHLEKLFVSLVFGILIACILLAIIIKILMETFRLATYDMLTGIYNRASYMHHIDKVLTRSSDYPVGLLMIDLDNFKYVNDTFGHSEGDVVLKEFAEILKKVANKHLAVRFGGDEFAVVLTNTSEEELAKCAFEILDSVYAKQQHPGIWKHLSVSIGGSLQRLDNESKASLFTRADQALYVSKNQGKACYSFEIAVKEDCNG